MGIQEWVLEAGARTTPRLGDLPSAYRRGWKRFF